MRFLLSEKRGRLSAALLPHPYATTLPTLYRRNNMIRNNIDNMFELQLRWRRFRWHSGGRGEQPEAKDLRCEAVEAPLLDVRRDNLLPQRLSFVLFHDLRLCSAESVISQRLRRLI